MNDTILTVSDLSKDYIDTAGFIVHLLEGINFEVEPQTVTTILAPSGAGKSSLLKITAGLENPTAGKILIKDKAVFIPSKPSSFPWLNVSENIKFNSNNINEEKVKEIIEFVGLSGYEEHFAHTKSLGFRFRISLARAIIKEPSLLIIDETFGNMKSEIKLDLYGLVREAAVRYKLSVLFATTNISESLIISDIIYIMKKKPGEIVTKIDLKFKGIRDEKFYLTGDFVRSKNIIDSALNEHNLKELLVL